MSNNNMNWNPYQQYPYGSNGDTNYNSANPAHQQHQSPAYPHQYNMSSANASSNMNPMQEPYYQQHQVQPPAYPFSQQNVPQPPPYPGYEGASTSNPSQSHVQLQSGTMYPPQQNTNPIAYNNSQYNHTQYRQPLPPPPPPPTQMQMQSQNGGKIIDTPSIAQPYPCDACSISFPTKSALEAHTNSHIKCKKCSFTASKKVVGGHYKSKHGEYAGRGLKSVSIQQHGSRQVSRFKICVGNHPDDIKAWIEERKKRFPTRDRVLKREEKNKRNREEGALGGASGTKRQKTVAAVGDGKKEVATTEKPSSSISSLIAGYGSSSDEDETEAGKKSSPKINEMCREVTNNGPNHATALVEESASTFKTKPCRFFLRNGSCKNGDNCTYMHDLAQHEEYKDSAESRKQKQSQRDRARNEAKREMNLITTGREQAGSSKGGAPGGQTLLRKLLQNDIRRERSLCLQLLRYIADCNYLQEKKEAKSSEQV